MPTHFWWRLATLGGVLASLVVGAMGAPKGSGEVAKVKGFADVVQERRKSKARSSRRPSLPARAPEPQSSPSSLAHAARHYLGRRYRYGGTSPSRGFDCSGFVHFLLSRHGIRAPRTAAELFCMGTPVPRGQLRPGDLVFFRNTARRRGITHVGIYIGDGKFIHASSGARRVVVSSLSDPYYAKRFAGARRLSRHGVGDR
jgi:cell wall-associated NlpC family hydrolase